AVGLADNYQVPDTLPGNSSYTTTVLLTGGGVVKPAMGGTSYNFVMGTGSIPPYNTTDNPWPSNGAFRYNNKPVRFAQITDGLSNTLFVGPRPFGGGNPLGSSIIGYWGGFSTDVGNDILPLN